jgi:MoaA/NifB/PqqE/SkfB family radical SAM enzyme
MPAPLAGTYRRIYEGLNYRLRTVAGGHWADHCRPTSITFLLTELCNARCVHCDIWKNRGKENSPGLEQWRVVLRDLREWLGPVQVTFSGGEALLVPFATDLVSYGSSLGLFMECLTHGYWLEQSRIEKLALARPWRVTVSLDGIGETHSKVRGREKFWEKTTTSLQTLQRVRKENSLNFMIRLKTVVMSHNLHDVANVALFAGAHEGMEVFYQPIEQNYNTPEDSRWFEHNDNWPTDIDVAIRTVRGLIELKHSGLPVANSFDQLEAMIPYFRDPDSHRVTVQSHQGHERRALCAALTTLQFHANGDVRACYGMDPIGNIKQISIREMWEKRPPVWEGGCCLERRCTTREKETLSLTVIS